MIVLYNLIESTDINTCVFLYFIILSVCVLGFWLTRQAPFNIPYVIFHGSSKLSPPLQVSRQCVSDGPAVHLIINSLALVSRFGICLVAVPATVFESSWSTFTSVSSILLQCLCAEILARFKPAYFSLLWSVTRKVLNFILRKLAFVSRIKISLCCFTSAHEKYLDKLNCNNDTYNVLNFLIISTYRIIYC